MSKGGESQEVHPGPTGDVGGINLILDRCLTALVCLPQRDFDFQHYSFMRANHKSINK